MVFCGKPSRGCQMCRTRRIKCDETKPTCNQCAKSRRQCPGYRDEFDLVFRNETKATERRAQKANRKALSQQVGKQESWSPSSSSEGSPLSAHSNPSFEQTLVASPTISPELQATCHFFSNFVLVPQQGSTRGYMDWLVPLLKSEPQNGHFLRAFNACAYASLGNRVTANGINLSDMALSEYSRALAATHAAIRDPVSCKSDGTLASVLLLSLFENLTARQMGMFAWGSHVEGATQLVKARGRKQLRTKMGLALFIATRTQLIIHSLTSGKAPIMGVDWWLSDAVQVETAAQVQRLNFKTGELRARLAKLIGSVARTPENVELMLDVIRQAQTIDQEAVNWMKNVPDHWHYKTIAWEDNVPNGDYAKTEVFPGRVDVYQDFYIASVWNMARITRVILASAIVRCAAWVCSPVDYRTTPEYATAARTCADTITDIIASVPYQLGWHTKRKHLFDSKELCGFPCGDDDSMKGLGGYFLTWPLGVLRGLDYTTDNQRAWIVGRLNYIGDELGVQYAHILCQLQIRIPSMLIRRDTLMAHPYPQQVGDFQKLLSARLAPPTAGYTMNPLQQREAMQKEYFEQRRAELLAKAAGSAAPATKPSVQWVAQKWLAV